jgi:hypothetical protein
MRLAGKAYVLDGSDEVKLTTLRLLAASDFLSAAWVGVPKSISVNRPDGQMRGVANTSLLSNPISHSVLFNSLLETLEKSLPDQVKCKDGDYVSFRMARPESPLCITTVVMEYADGRLMPMVKA